MIFCKPKYSVCKECQVHFEPAEDHQKRWGDLCPAHRKPVMEEDLKKDEAIRWAYSNWRKIYGMIQSEKEEHNKREAEIRQAHYNAMCGSANNQMSNSYGHGKK